MNPVIVVLEYAAGFVGILFWAWALGLACMDIDAHRASAESRRIKAGWVDVPAPVEPEPLRRIAWEDAEATMRALGWATGELERIKAELLAVTT